MDLFYKKKKKKQWKEKNEKSKKSFTFFVIFSKLSIENKEKHNKKTSVPGYDKGRRASYSAEPAVSFKKKIIVEFRRNSNLKNRRKRNP